MEKENFQIQKVGTLDIDGAKAHYSMFNKFKKAICKNGIDFGKIPGIDKESLFQAGAQKLAKAFNLSHTTALTDKTIDINSGLCLYEYKVTVFNQHGVIVGEGVGGCNSFEDKYCFTAWVKAQKPDANEIDRLRSLSLGKFQKAFNGGDMEWKQRSRKNPIDLIALQNTIMKMAAKRAYVHAILNSTGGGEFFTQDIEDMPSVINEAEQRDELLRFVFWACEYLCAGRPDLKQCWDRLPHLRTNADFVAMMQEMSAKHPADNG